MDIFHIYVQKAICSRGISKYFKFTPKQNIYFKIILFIITIHNRIFLNLKNTCNNKFDLFANTRKRWDLWFRLLIFIIIKISWKCGLYLIQERVRFYPKFLAHCTVPYRNRPSIVLKNSAKSTINPIFYQNVWRV